MPYGTQAERGGQPGCPCLLEGWSLCRHLAGETLLLRGLSIRESKRLEEPPAKFCQLSWTHEEGSPRRRASGEDRARLAGAWLLLVRRGEKVQLSPTGNPIGVLCREGEEEGEAQCLHPLGRVCRRREAPKLLLICVRTGVPLYPHRCGAQPRWRTLSPAD